MAEQGTAAQEPGKPAVAQPGTEAPAVAAPAVEARPEYLDQRFKTVEDQAKAYKEAERKMQQEANIRAELERQNRELLARQQTAPPPPPQENLNELFWTNPAEVMNRLIERKMTEGIQPFIEDRYAMQKQTYANDPEFKKYEAQIDQVVSLQPELKKQAGAVERLYRVMKSMDFDPEAERNRIRAEEAAKLQGKAIGQVEGAGAPGTVPQTPKMELSEEERGAALRFYSELPPQEAYKRYYDSKIRMLGGA